MGARLENRGSMALYAFNMQRLFVPDDLFAGAEISPAQAQTHYLLNVLRLRAGEEVLLFNGRDGEWRASLCEVSKRACRLQANAQTRAQTVSGDLHYLFAPLKKARLDYMVQKATEMGASALRPVLTARTNADRINLDRMRANVIEAAEQCGIISVPAVHEPQKFADCLAGWDPSRQLILCDEDAPLRDPLAALRAVRAGPVSVLIGPEGGFSAEEREIVRTKTFVTVLSLGPRILRADTAAVAALALVQAVLGDMGG